MTKRKQAHGWQREKPTKAKKFEVSDSFAETGLENEIDGVLEEGKLPVKSSEIRKRLKSLVSYLKKLPQSEERDLRDTSEFGVFGVEIPLKVGSPTKARFKFEPPTDIEFVGGHSYGTLVAPFVVDMAITMPAVCLQAKDRLNERYFVKRAQYLATLAYHLKTKYKVEYSLANGIPLLPDLLLSLPEPMDAVTVRVDVVLPDEAIPLNKLHIERSNLRPSWYGAASQTELGDPTPVYNNVLLRNRLTRANSALISDVINTSNGVKDGVKLLKMWLEKREMRSKNGTGFLLTAYVVYLLKKNEIKENMSALEVFRKTLLFLAKFAFDEPISLRNDESTLEDVGDVTPPSVDDMAEIFPVVFQDASGYLNFAARLEKMDVDRLKHEAQIALKMLQNPGNFITLLKSAVPFNHKFDVYYTLESLSPLRSIDEKDNSSLQKLRDHHGDVLGAFHYKLATLIDHAVGRRVLLCDRKVFRVTSWPVSEGAPDRSPNHVTFGFLVRGEAWLDVVERGPPADQPEAVEFRNFWGEKAELRRFTDGGICEGVVWPAENLNERRAVIGQVLDHVFAKHLGLKKASMYTTLSQLDRYLKFSKDKTHLLSAGTGEEREAEVLREFEQLSQMLRGLKELPLNMQNIQVISPTARCAEVFPPLRIRVPPDWPIEGNFALVDDQKPPPPYVQRINVVALLEGSGKWPDDIDELRKVKRAFHKEVAKALRQKHNLCARVKDDRVFVNKGGFIFCIHIAPLREIRSLRKVGACSPTVTSEAMVDNLEEEDDSDDEPSDEWRVVTRGGRSAPVAKQQQPEVVATVAKMENEARALEVELLALPKLTSSLHGIQLENSAFSATLRLTRRWLSSQLLLDHIPDPVSDLLVANVFLHPQPFAVPGSPLCAFRRVLRLLSTHNWRANPLNVNLSDGFTTAELSDSEALFARNRDSMPAAVIVTPGDLESSWTRDGPTALMLLRLRKVAKAALSFLDNVLMELSASTTSLKLLFSPPLDTYDVIIHMLPRLLPRRHLNTDTGKTFVSNCYKQKKDATNDVILVTNHDPARDYVKTLRKKYGKYALFFHDKFGGKYVAVLWKREAFVNKSECGIEKPDVESLLNSFKEENEELVVNIDAKIDRWKI